jgi:hypothetical protein
VLSDFGPEDARRQLAWVYGSGHGGCFGCRFQSR